MACHEDFRYAMTWHNENFMPRVTDSCLRLEAGYFMSLGVLHSSCLSLVISAMMQRRERTVQRVRSTQTSVMSLHVNYTMISDARTYSGRDNTS